MYGTSYGTYIAAGVGVRHPGRVRAMILDSPLLSTHDIDAVRDAVRGLLLEGSDPQTAELAPKFRRLVDDGLIKDAGHVATMVYAYGGAALLDRQLDLLLRGRTWLWSGLSRLGTMSSRKVPYRNETDLVARIAFRELNYAGVPDGLPLDPAVAMREMTDITAPFENEPYDLVAEMPKFGWPTSWCPAAAISPLRRRWPSASPRDTRCGAGAAFHRGSQRAGHPRARGLAIIDAVRNDEIGGLSGPKLDALPGRPALRLLVSAISAAAAAESALPAAVPRVVQRISSS